MRTWLVRPAREESHLAGGEITSKCAQLAKTSNIVVLQPGVRDISNCMPKREVVGGKKPFCKVPIFGFEPTAFVITLTARNKADIEELAPRMNQHSSGKVGFVHLRFGAGKPIMSDSDPTA